MRRIHIVVLFVFTLVGQSAAGQSGTVKGIDDAPVPGSFLGWSSSIEGDRMVLGAPEFQGGDGAAWILEFDGWGWDVIAQLEGSNSLAGAEFGAALALSGDTVLVGAPSEDGGETRSGAAYLHERDASGAWVQVAHLRASDQQRNADFGVAVALSGDLAVVGAPLHVDSGMLGAVYVFRRDAGGDWPEVASIRLTDSTGARFGASVSVDGERFVVGAPRNDTDGSVSGSAHLYEMTDAKTWIEIETLLPEDAAEEASFGFAVALDGPRVLVGAPRDETDLGVSGAAYLFEDSKTGWRHSLKLEPEELDPDDNTRGQVRYGHCVDMADGLLTVGAPFDRRNGPRSGTTYVYDAIPNVGILRTRLHPEDPQIEQFFGFSCAVSGRRVLAGAPLDDRDGLLSGGAYVFEPYLSTPAWFQSARLKPAQQ